MSRQRISIEQVKQFLREIAHSIPSDATVDNVPDEQKWIVETGFHLGAKRWIEQDALQHQEHAFLMTKTTNPFKPLQL